MKICLVGGIYGMSPQYRQAHRITPETVLESGLRSHGFQVDAFGHFHRIDYHAYDLIHVHHLGWGAVRAASAAGAAPLVFTTHNGAFLVRHISAARARALRFVASRCDAMVALADHEAAVQASNLPLRGAVQRVIPNGIPAEHFWLERRNAQGIGRPWQLLYVGQLSGFKRVDILLRALALVPNNVELRLAYQVPTLEPELKQLAATLGISARVHFLGPRHPAELRELYQSSDVFVLPSSIEVLPSVVTEALLCGTPVVATDVGAVRDQVGPYGRIVPSGDVGSLAAALQSMLRDYVFFSSQAAAMSEYARYRFSTETMVSAHIRVYRDLAERGAVPRRHRPGARMMNWIIARGVELACRNRC